MSGNAWTQMVEHDPDHSHWYVQRFRSMEADGHDLGGEARLVDALVARGARVLDAGAGPGRVGGRLARAGHDVVGVDIDPVLIEAAEADFPGPTWLVGDIADLTTALTAAGVTEPFDAIVCAGNVMTFLGPDERRPTLAGFAAHLAPDGRAAIGFGPGRGYPVETFLADAESAGLVPDVLLGTWDLRALTQRSDFLVALLRHA